MQAESSTLLPQVVSERGKPAIELTLGLDSIDLEYWIQRSTDLSDWESIPPTRVHGQAGETIRIPLKSESHDRMFGRLLVNPPSN